jgi:prepilin-type N-terminal cleavage/methylation domain-containing protein
VGTIDGRVGRAAAVPETGNPESGMSLVELMIVVAILGIMLVTLSNAYQVWSERYRVENEIKELYADLMDARARAMQKSRAHFVAFYGTGTEYSRYAVYEDTNTGPDGNGVLDNTLDARIRDVQPRYRFVTAPAGTDEVMVNRDGTLNLDSATIRVPPPGMFQADYDCIALSRTRIKMGRYNGADCVER